MQKLWTMIIVCTALASARGEEAKRSDQELRLEISIYRTRVGNLVVDKRNIARVLESALKSRDLEDNQEAKKEWTDLATAAEHGMKKKDDDIDSSQKIIDADLDELVRRNKKLNP